MNLGNEHSNPLLENDNTEVEQAFKEDLNHEEDEIQEELIEDEPIDVINDTEVQDGADDDESVLLDEDRSRVKYAGFMQKLKTNGKNVVLAIVGIISAAAVPVWQIYFVETSEVNIEISSISRIKSPNFKVPLDTDELILLEPYIGDEYLYEYNAQGERGDRIDYPVFSMETLVMSYDKAKQDLKNISVTKAKLQEHIDIIDRYLDPSNNQHKLSEFRVSELKQWDLSNYIDDAEADYYEDQVLKITRDYSQMKFVANEGPQIKFDSLKYLLGDVKEDIIDVIKNNDTLLEVLRDNIRSIETQLDKLKQEQINLNTFFKVGVVASNAGRVSTSLRPLALMRVQISDENYVDIRLKMDNYKEQAELQPSSTNIIHYRSTDLFTFPAEDLSLINTFWGSSGRVRLFSLDTKQNIYTSNQIAFVDNLNQKVMLDKLKEVASRNMR